MEDELTAVAERIGARGGSVGTGSVGGIARAVRVLAPSTSVGELDTIWRDLDVSSVAVAQDGSERVGIITRPHYTAAMTGRLGYGRAVFLRRAVGELADWRPLVVQASTSIAEVAASAMARSGEHRYDDILVAGDGWRVAESADVTVAMVTALAQRSTHDPLTGLPGRSATWQHLRRRCERARGGRARVALILVDVRGMWRINAQYGQHAGDIVLRALGQRLADGRPAGCEVGRVGGDQFAVLATLPPIDEAGAAVTVDLLREQVIEALRTPSADVPESVWPAVTAAASWLGTGAQGPDELIRAAEHRLRQARSERVPQ